MPVMKRRDFLKGITIGAIALIGVPSALKGISNAAIAADPAPTMLDPKDSLAVAVKYVENNKKSKDAKGNHCATCMFYTKKDTIKGKETGACQIFPGKLVYGNGYCNSWSKKAG